MSNAGWKATIQSGNADIDLQMLDRHRQSAQQQGLVLHSRNLQTGGFEVAAAPPGAPSPFDAPAAIAQTKPSPYAPPAMGYGPPVPAPRQIIRPQWAPVVGEGAACQACGREAPLKQVTFMQNIGLVFMRLPKTIRGFLCKHCIDKYFWEMSGITFLFGWWGVISFIYTLIALPSNLFNYLGALSLPEPPDDLRSLDAKKTRSVVMIIFGMLVGLLAAFWTLVAFGLMLSDDPDDLSDGLVNLGIAVVLLWAPALTLFIGGIVKRVRAGRKDAELRASGAY